MFWPRNNSTLVAAFSQYQVGVSGPGVVKQAVEKAIKNDPDIDLGGLAKVIKKISFKVTMSKRFVRFGGRIPAPLHSLNN